LDVFVVTPYYRADPAWLRQAHASVKAQTVPARHILVCDGSERVDLDGFDGEHIVLPRNYSDYGNTPRLIGCYLAISRGADAIAFLDADNWFQPTHVADLLGFAEANGLDMCASARMLHRLDGTPMVKCPHVDGRRYIDTNCLLVRKTAFPHLVAWALAPQEVAATGDQFLWKHMLRQGARFGFLDRPTVAYRTRHAVHYRIAREPVPDDAITRVDTHGERYC